MSAKMSIAVNKFAGRCNVSEPWPCTNDVAGTTGLGAILCVRHFAAVIAPLRDPFTSAERLAMRPRYERVQLGGNVSSHHDVIAPPTLELVAERNFPDIVTMPVATSSGTFVTLTHDDSRLPATGRTAIRRAIEAGFKVRATLAQAHVLIRCQRDAELITFSFDEGRFVRSWHVANRHLDSLGYRAATALLVGPVMSP